MYDSQESPARRRAKYSVLIGIILLTVPFYVVGAAALVIAPHDPTPQPPPTATSRTSYVNAKATQSGLIPTISLMPTLLDVPTLTPFDIETATPEPTSTITDTPAPAEATMTPSPDAAIDMSLPPGLRKHRKHK